MSKTYREKINRLDASNEPIAGSVETVKITNVTDGIQVQIAGATFIVERSVSGHGESRRELTRLFVIAEEGDDEMFTAEIYGRKKEDHPVKIFTAGGKVLFDSEVDNRYAKS